jgi:uncharacterized membrane protein YoaK (UPF0700 family)
MTGIGNFLGRLANVDERHGPLPILLLGLTVLTGMVDAISYLRLGHVFVANMTGNIVFLGFALAGVSDFSVASSLTAIAAFLAGAGLGGGLGRRHHAHRGFLFWTATALETLLVALALALSASNQLVYPLTMHYGLIILLGIMMGLQNAVVRRLAVPDLTTTVLTLTLTGLAADAGPAPANRLHRLSSVVAMLGGAALGGLLVLKGEVRIALAAGLLLLIAVSVVAFLGRKSNQAWVSSR